jgi:hypothetical protein
MYLVKHIQHPTGYSFTFVDGSKNITETEFTRHGMACSCSKDDHDMPCAHFQFVALKVFKSKNMIEMMKKHQGRFSIFKFAFNIRQLYAQAFHRPARDYSSDSSESSEDSSDDEISARRKKRTRINYNSDVCAICFRPFSTDNSDCWVYPNEDGCEVHEACKNMKNNVFAIKY